MAGAVLAVICALVLLGATLWGLVAGDRIRRVPVQTIPQVAASRRIMMVVLCTPNFDPVGLGFICQLSAYCVRHGYGLRVCRDHLVPELHINYSRFELVRNVLQDEEDRYDYVCLVDADSVLRRGDIRIEQILAYAQNPLADIFAPRDAGWSLIVGDWSFVLAFGTGVNFGFSIFAPSAVLFLGLFLHTALHTDCGREWKEKVKKGPVTQTVFVKCGLAQHVTVSHLPWELVGVRRSTVISQNILPWVEERENEYKVQMAPKDRNAAVEHAMKQDVGIIQLVRARN